MPEIPAEPGDWSDLLGQLFCIAMDPTGEDNVIEENTAGMFGPFIYWMVKLNPEKRADLSEEGFDLIARSQPDRLNIGQSAAKLAYGLVTAGHILSHVLRLGRHNPSLASVEKAVRILEWRYTQEKSPSSPASIKAAWSKYKYLSPFVVGFFAEAERAEPVVADMPKFWNPDVELKRDLEISPEGMKAYLTEIAKGNGTTNLYHERVTPHAIAVAEKFRVAGEKHFAPGQEVRHTKLPNR